MKKILLAFCLIFPSFLFAQQTPMIAFFHVNRLYYNPGSAGSNERFNISILYRKQWVGINRAPELQILSADLPLAKNKLGFGVVALHDKAGTTDQFDFNLNLSYRIKLWNEVYLSPGIKGGFSYFDIGAKDLKYWDSGDVVFTEDQSIRAMIPRLGAGFHLYSTNIYAGVSVPDLLSLDINARYLLDKNKTVKLFRNFIFNGGINFILSNRLAFSPSMIVRAYGGNKPTFGQVNFALKWNEQHHVGIGFNTALSLTLFGQIALLEKIKIAYAFDFDPFGSNLQSAGSHELMGSYGFQY